MEGFGEAQGGGNAMGRKAGRGAAGREDPFVIFMFTSGQDLPSKSTARYQAFRTGSCPPRHGLWGDSLKSQPRAGYDRALLHS